MRKIMGLTVLTCLLSVLVFSACNSSKTIDANELKANSKTDAAYNTKYLQGLMDKASDEKATIILPEGKFYFAEQETLFDGQETYAIKCRNNVTVTGAGTKTILYPIGEIGPDRSGGIDMFFFNDYRESNFTNPNYLENANFNNFVIDGANTKLSHYNTAGKGFMINLFKNCNFEKLIVRNIDATGIGIDCPVNSTIKDCITENCGKSATLQDQGASGIGIGFGYSADESLTISNCQCFGSKKFGIFFEWQGRWNSTTEKAYSHKDHKKFLIENCYASKNEFADLGGLYSYDVEYNNCFGDKYYFGPNSSGNLIDGKEYNGNK
ncbi:MAG: hypothetical protein Q4E88_04610 [Coriobacteriia bacterium]|nr:hypothetical protein [Coriobacteriia bacterium]